MKTSIFALLFATLVSAPTSAEPSSETIGHIQRIEGLVSVQRGSTTLPGATGTALIQGDIIRTGKPASAGIVLSDDSRISLGSSSEFVLTEYAFEPKENKFALTLKMVKGTFSYISGQIVKLAPKKARLQTPDTTIAVRGTKLLIEIKE